MMLKLLVILGLPLVDGRFYILHYNYTNNPLVNNSTFKMELQNGGSKNFSYELDVWNKVDVITENRKPLKSLQI
jgi:hypothetical protein